MTAPGAALVPVDREVDAQGLDRPWPGRCATSAPGSRWTVRVLPTGTASVRGFRELARHTGNELVGRRERDGAFWFVQKPR
ncbi:Sulfur carrier protein TusA [Burkholderiales bacterium]|nr:Sulfur carrier protein TusA [Burkholderiales bacterium]